MFTANTIFYSNAAIPVEKPLPADYFIGVKNGGRLRKAQGAAHRKIISGRMNSFELLNIFCYCFRAERLAKVAGFRGTRCAWLLRRLLHDVLICPEDEAFLNI